MKIAITGANSSVGQSLLARIIVDGNISAIASVRSESAFKVIPKASNIKPCTIDYADINGLAATFEGADAVVHLAGILIESRHTSYQQANVDATAAVVKAARTAGVGQIIFVSVVGADAQSPNPYFRSKGQAEQFVREAGIPGCSIRTPLLIGPGTAGASAIRWAASRETSRLLDGGRYTMHPLDVDDLCQAILHRCREQWPASGVYELVGPEAIQYRDLIRRVAKLQGREIKIGATPIWLAKLGSAVTSRLRGGISPAVIDVITLNETVSHNDHAALGVTLTPLDETLKKILADTGSQ